MHHLQLRDGHKMVQRRPQGLTPARNYQPGLYVVKAKARKQQQPTVEQVEDQDQVQSPSGFSAVVQRLLHRAASSLTRGTTTCLTCKGQGTCTCPVCNGAGVTEKDARQNVMRHTAQKLRSVLNVERSEYHSDWLTSNRCRRCHGTGAMICPTCQGMGTRHAAQNPDKGSN